MNSVIKHYDLLIENGNDPFLDGPELSKYMDKWDGQTFINLLDLTKNKSVLEIGCGTGRIAKKIIERCGFYTGVDISPKTIVVAKNHFTKNSNTLFINADFIEYNFNQQYDVILSSLTFMHIADKKLALTKIFRLLKIGGKLVLSIDKNQQNFIDTGYNKIKIYPDNPQKICEIMKETGFRNISVSEVEFAYIITAQRK